MADQSNRVVLVLKSNNQDDAYEKLLRARGYEPIFIPVLSFQFTNKDVLIKRLENPAKHYALILTSQRAVDAVDNCISDTEFQEKWRSSLQEEWSSVPVFVTGKASGKRVREKLNFGYIFGEDSGNSESLAQIILNKLPPNQDKDLLFPCANIKKETLPKILEKEGYSLVCVTAYSTKPDPNISNALKEHFSERQPVCVVFFSPSGVTFSGEVLQKTFPKFNDIKLISIGQTTSQAIQENGFKVSGVAQKPDPPSLVEAIDTCLKHSS